MNFRYSKLPRSAAADLQRLPVNQVKPFALMMSPTYVFMRRNEKFLCVKAPLDFFLPEEIERIQPLGNLFVLKFVDSVLPFRDAAKSLKMLFNWKPRTVVEPAVRADGKLVYPEVPMPPAPYEVSDAALRIVGPLWSAQGSIEPFFITAFVHEFCEPLAEDILRKAREQDVNLCERAMIVSAIAVFLLIHLGNCDYTFLNRFRASSFKRLASGEMPGLIVDESDEIIDLAEKIHDLVGATKIDFKTFESFTGVGASKLRNRFKRVEQKLKSTAAKAPTVFGPGGFLDV